MAETQTNEVLDPRFTANEGLYPPITIEDIDLLLGMIRQMAGFLQDPLGFAESVRQQRNPLTERWHDILEMLARDPILGKQEDNWYWLYDFFGNPQAPPPSKQMVATPKAADLSEKLGTTVSEVRAVIAKIRGIDSAVSEYTEQRLNLDQLAIGLRLLEVSPDYATFEHAASSYLANAGPGPDEALYASLSTDRLVLQQYYDLLNRCWLNMKWAFFIAAAIGVEENQARTNTRTRTNTIRLVSDDLDFSRLSTDQLQAVLGEFENDLAEIDPLAEHLRKVYDELIAHPLDKGWFEVMSLRTETEPPLWKATDEGVRIWAYFRSRFKALILHIRNGKPLRRLTLLELSTRFHSSVSPFHGDPNTMTLATYAEALFQAGPGHLEALPAYEFVYACAIKLGFGPQISIMSLVPTVQQEDTFDLMEAAQLVIRSGERVLLILGNRLTSGKGELPLVQIWTISQRHAVFPVYSEFSWLPDLNKLDFSLVLFEDTSRDTIEGWRQQGVIGSDARVVEMVKSRGDRGGLLVVQPKDLDDAVAQALRPDPKSSAS
jgi:hypothetical protein